MKIIDIDNKCGFGLCVCRSKRSGDCKFYKDNGWNCKYNDETGNLCENTDAQNDLLQSLLKQKHSKICTWERCEEDLSYNTNCGNVMSFSGHYTYSDNKFFFCPFCGSEIIAHNRK
jgi:hypothetical protein